MYLRQKPRLRLQAQSFGGGQEQGLRSGTLATHQIVGFGEAFALAEQERPTEQARLLRLRQQLWQGIHDVPGLQLNGHPSQRVAGNLNLSLQGVDGASLLPALHELAVSSSSACAAASHQASHVLRAIGLSKDLAQSSVRLSLGRFTTEEEVQQAIVILQRELRALRRT